jgi:hypothetical protein
MQLRQAISSVLETTKQETDIYDRWLWVEASISEIVNVVVASTVKSYFAFLVSIITFLAAFLFRPCPG